MAYRRENYKSLFSAMENSGRTAASRPQDCRDDDARGACDSEPLRSDAIDVGCSPVIVFNA
jgi:hypothetical protein